MSDELDTTIDDQTTGDNTLEAVDDGGEPDAGKTLADGGDDTVQASAPDDWPEDWRSKLAGDDEKALKKLDRYQSPKDVMSALLAAQSKISEGQKPLALGDDPTDEEVAAYRKAMNVPETHEAYFNELPDGLVIGENDKELAGSFAEALHKVNAPAPVAAAALAWYQQNQTAAVEKAAEDDKAYHQKAEDELRAEWGAEYRANVNSVTAFLDATPTLEDGTRIGDLLRGARLPDGTVAGDNPAMMRWFAKLAQEANPAGFIAPSDGMSQVDSVNSEIAEIEKFMKTNPSAYYKDEAKQARLRQLYEAQEKLQAK